MSILQQDIKYLQGVGPHRAELLEKELGIKTVNDLLTYYPYKHIDRSHIYRICEIDGNMPYVQLCGQILSFETIGEGKGKRLVAHFSDGTGIIDLVWFQGIKYAANSYKCRTPYLIFGKPGIFNARINIAHPEIEDAPAELRHTARTTGNLFEENTTEVISPQETTVANIPSAPSFRPFYNTSDKMKKGSINSATILSLI